MGSILDKNFNDNETVYLQEDEVSTLLGSTVREKVWILQNSGNKILVNYIQFSAGWVYASRLSLFRR